MPSDASIGIKALQLRLGVPQHVLIHLCEKGVVEPELAQTSGRGKRRAFSERNVLEFAVALALRGMELPVSRIAVIVRLLASFLRAVSKAQPNLDVLAALSSGVLELVLYLHDDGRLVLSAHGRGLRGGLLLSAKLPESSKLGRSPSVVRLAALPADYDVRLEVNLTRIAQEALG